MQNDKIDLPNYDAMLYKICQDEGIELKFLCTNWLKQLEKGNKVSYIHGWKFDINSYAAGLVADDKSATYEVLESAKIPAVEHVILYDFTNRAEYTLGRNSLPYVEKYLERHKNIVIKPNCGTGGTGVYKISDKNQLKPILIELFHGNPTLCMCPYHKVQREYRTIWLDGELKLAYMKTAMPGEWKFNLSHGAKAEEIPSDKYGKIVELAQRTTKVMGLRFCSIDIVETEANEMLVLEVNSGVMVRRFLSQHPERYKDVEEMYREAVRKMFE